MSYKPTGHHVMVQPDVVEEKTEGGLYIPKTVQKDEEGAQTFGVLVAVGPNAWKGFDEGIPWCQVGDRVVFSRYGGRVLTDPRTKEVFRVLNDEDICAVITED